jgi:hypothetical protein
MLRRLALVRADISEELSASFIRVTRIPPKRRFLQEPHGVTSQKMPFFIVTAVKTSNLTNLICGVSDQHKAVHAICWVMQFRRNVYYYGAERYNKRRHQLVGIFTVTTLLHTQQNPHIQSNTQANLELRNTASTSNTEILERFQSKVLRLNIDAPWYVTNMVIWSDLQIPIVKEESRHYSSQYSARLSVHSNNLVVNLMAQPDNRRLQRHLPNDYSIGFLV